MGADKHLTVVPEHRTATVAPSGDDGVTLVGIAGGTSSGKSYLASRIADTVIEMDMFYKGYPDHRAPNVNFDHPRTMRWEALEHTVRAIAAGAADYVTIPRYSFEENQPVGRDAVGVSGVVAVEGLWALLDYDGYTLTEHYDHTIFVDLPADVRLARRVPRDIHERGKSAEETVERYLRDARPMHDQWVEPTRHRADTIVRGDMDDITRERVGL